MSRKKAEKMKLARWLRARGWRKTKNGKWVRPNPGADRLELAEIGSVAEAGLGSGVAGAGANKFLQVISTSYGGGGAFTAAELAREAGASESGAREAIKALRRKGYVHEMGRELTRLGKKGAMRFVGTLIAEERAQAARDVASQVEGERLAVETIEEAERRAEAALQDFLGAERAKPGKGSVYRPTIHRRKTPGHKLPPLTKKRLKAAGYRVNARRARKGAKR